MNYKKGIIDIQSHFLPEKWLAELEKREEYPRLEKMQHVWMVHGSRHDKLPFDPSQSGINIHCKLKEMDETGVELSLLSLNTPGPDNIKNSVESDRLAVLANDGIAEIVSTYPHRFKGVATIGYGSVPSALVEVKRCFEELGFVGLQVFPYIGGRLSADDSSLEPIWDYIENKGIPMIIHPGCPINPDYGSHLIGPLMGYYFDEAAFVVKLILGGFFERHQKIKVICPHVWSILPAIVDRLDFQVNKFKGFFPNVTKLPSEYLSKIHTDSVCFSTDTMEFAINKFGVSRMMFGSDNPFVPMKLSLEIINRLSLDDKQKEAIARKNALELFSL